MAIPVTASFLDVRFLLLLVLLGLVRWLWPARNFVLFGAVASAAGVFCAAPTTFIAISVITLGFLFPLHRAAVHARERNSPRWVPAVILVAGVGLLTLLLVLSKAYRYFTIPGLGGPWLASEIVSLIGFSYFIFRAIDFLHIQSILPFKESRPWTL